MTFKPAARYPADPRVVFILALSVFSGITSLAFRSSPKSLDDVMPHWAVMVWGTLLVAGSLTTLIGIAKNTLNGIILEQIGSVTVAATTIFYSVTAFAIVGTGAISPVGIILAWGIACLIRWGQLQALINHAYREKIRIGVEQTFLADLDDLS